MKHSVLIFLLFCLAFTASSQETPLYLKQRTVPPAMLLLSDSTKWQLKTNLQKDKQLLIMLFNPECDHCQHETEELIKNIDRFKDIQIVMSTTKPFDEMKAFIANYKLAQYPNIIAGKDISYLMISYFDVKSMPYLAFYDKNKKLISTFEGSLSMDAILKVFGK